MRGFWSRLSGPLKIGLIIGLLGALLTVLGLVFGDFAPLTLRSLLLGILLGGGSWGLVSWAIASAAADATGSTAVDGTDPAAVEPGAATADPAPLTDQESG
jgi:predicted lipid-binding transport protein (Tim44 family)